MPQTRTDPAGQQPHPGKSARLSHLQEGQQTAGLCGIVRDVGPMKPQTTAVRLQPAVFRM